MRPPRTGAYASEELVGDGWNPACAPPCVLRARAYHEQGCTVKTTPNYCHTCTEDHTLPLNSTNQDHA
jgi:hypothetical protein